MKRILPLVALVALPLVVDARQLTPQEALTRAMGESPVRITSVDGTKAITPAYTAQESEITSLYVINMAQGYVVVSADDIAFPLLGYSETGSFDPENIPENMKWWLDEYNRQIAYAAANGISTVNRSPSRLANIEPLVEAKWNQSSPYNDQCPVIDGQRCVTGCVATALAQVMYYHKWPETGVGSHSYTYDPVGTLSIDYSAVTFDWDAMTPNYNSTSSEASKAAVAELMYCCGVGVDMKYGTGSSGAVSKNMMRVLSENFDYDPGMEYLSRIYFSNAQWEEMVYTELAAARPVLYDGQSGTGGHQFVCDGYRDGYFHINWGWGGMSDGYFMLTALDPSYQGIGGSASGYNGDQNILIGVQKPQTGSERHTIFYTMGALMPEQMTYSRNEYPVMRSYMSNGATSYFYNSTSATVNIYYGLKLVSADNSVYYCKGYFERNLAPGYGYNAFYPMMFDVPNGTYRVTGAVYDIDTDLWTDMLIPYDEQVDLSVTLTNDQVNFDVTGERLAISSSNLTMQTPLYANCNFKATATLTANKDCTVNVGVALFEVGGTEPIIWGPTRLEDLKGGEPKEIEYLSRFTSYAYLPTEGKTYSLCIVDDYLNPIGSPIDVVYKSAPSTTTVTLTDMYLVNGASAPSDDIHVHGTVKCTAGYLNSGIYVYLVSSAYKTLQYYSTPILFASEGESVDFDIHASYPDGVPGDTYRLYAYIDDFDYNHIVVFTMEAPASVAEANQLTFSVKALTADTPANTVAKKGNGEWKANKIELTDAVQFYNPTDFEAAEIAYTRNFGHDNWAALYLPFTLTPAEWTSYATRVIKYKGDMEIDGETVLAFQTVDANEDLEANYPYIILPAQTGTVDLTVYDKTLYATPAYDTCVNPADARYALYGQYEVKDDMYSANAYALSGGEFHPASSDAVTLMPFRVYLLPNAKAPALVPSRLPIMIDPEMSGIESMTADPNADGVMYDINGRPVNNPTTGVYILNGQKIYIIK